MEVDLNQVTLYVDGKDPKNVQQFKTTMPGLIRMQTENLLLSTSQIQINRKLL